jgi:large subunit ribosomal protein L19e
MNLKLQRKLAARAYRCSPQRVRFATERLNEIKEAITIYDVRALINKGAIERINKQGVSRGRARINQKQKAKGRRRGHGSRKGRAGARQHTKETWMNRIRLQRKFLNELREHKKIKNEVYRSLYQKAKGGFFRSKRHIKLYLEENKLII